MGKKNGIYVKPDVKPCIMIKSFLELLKSPTNQFKQTLKTKKSDMKMKGIYAIMTNKTNGLVTNENMSNKDFKNVKLIHSSYDSLISILNRYMNKMDIDATDNYTIKKIFENERYNKINKVKIDIIAKKSIKEEFLDKTRQLSGAEFYIDKGEKFDYNKRQIVIGNLNGRNSDFNHYVFNLPYKWKDDQTQTNKFLKYIEDEPKINLVTPNLRGDQAKISWLNEAMTKITNPKEGLDMSAGIFTNSSGATFKATECIEDNIEINNSSIIMRQVFW